MRQDPMSDSSFIQQLDARIAKPFLIGFSQAMDLVFLIGSWVMVIALVVVWFLPHVEFGSGSAYVPRRGCRRRRAGRRSSSRAARPSH
jgi:hypothetical protein